MKDAHASGPPDWNTTDHPGSLRRYASWLNEVARATFLTDKTHVEIFFLLKSDGTGGLVQPPAGMDRTVFLGAMKISLQEHDIYGVIHIVEAWSYFPRKPNDHTMKQVVEGEIAVSELKPGDKTECLLVRVEGRDGAQHLWLSPILRTADGVALADPIEMDEPMGGRFGSFFDRT